MKMVLAAIAMAIATPAAADVCDTFTGSPFLCWENHATKTVNLQVPMDRVSVATDILAGRFLAPTLCLNLVDRGLLPPDWAVNFRRADRMIIGRCEPSSP